VHIIITFSLRIYGERNNKKVLAKYLFCSVNAFSKVFYSNQISMTNKKQEKSHSISRQIGYIFRMSFRKATCNKAIAVITNIDGKRLMNYRR